ncbi:P-loop containing nucleoside triphosphate hydrolase protein [Suillus ampliporus]|nr:P-loop containing nucleoside triphosphate hydrolase protein [Suillus ampliporus]
MAHAFGIHAAGSILNLRAPGCANVVLTNYLFRLSRLEGETGETQKHRKRKSRVKTRCSLLSIFAMLSSAGRASSPTESYYTSDQSAAGTDSYRVKDATCNVVIFGETGAGKSSLVNLIAGTGMAQTSSDARGCTTDIRVYSHDIEIQNKILEVKLFDTAGLGEGSYGIVPDRKARNDLEKLLGTLMKADDIHLLMYCVQGTKNCRALHRNYKLLHSKVKGRVPIVLVVTGLENREPEMEEWWKSNEKSMSTLGMTFDGHACITAMTINRSDPDRLKRRCEQSHHAICNLIDQCRAARKTKNIVLFGETGAGKSSLVNLMAGSEVASTSLSMRRCTLHWQQYTIAFGGEVYKVFDTIGLEDPRLGMKEYLESVENIYRLIKELDRQGGIDLLLFCMRAGRISATLQSNYRLFHEFLCEKKVPTVLAITNLEREQRMEDWWDREHHNFEQYKIHVAGHACITAANGLDGRHQRLYEDSRITIRNLVKEFTVDDRGRAWQGGDNLFVSLMRKLKELLSGNSRVRRADIVPHLTKRCGVSRDVAIKLADMIRQ